MMIGPVLPSRCPGDDDRSIRCGGTHLLVLSTSERLTFGVFVAMSVLAGGNAAGARFSNRGLEPMWGAALRLSLAAIVLPLIMG
jgi:hypothetical protein